MNKQINKVRIVMWMPSRTLFVRLVPDWKGVQGCATLKTPYFRHLFLAQETHSFKPFSSSKEATSIF